MRDAAAVEEAVAISLLRLSLDTKALRLVKEFAQLAADPSAAEVSGLLERISARLEPSAPDRADRIRQARAWARQSVDSAAKGGFQILPWFDSEYPPWLWAIPDPPAVLWIRGVPEVLSRPAVAVVGSRRATPSGLTVARQLGQDLARAGLVVVSGMARGIDGAAHLGALDAGGQTVAILGCGLDLTYPPEHAALAGRIAENGAVASEFPPGMPPLPPHFPLRNRIISGLSRAIVVVEASEKSGSLITARAALEQGRDVLAVPGGIASGRYRGCHALIKDGARLVETVDDVLEEIGWARRAVGAGSGDVNANETSPLELVMAAGEAYTLEDLAARTGTRTPELLAQLGTLELAGRVSRLTGGTYIRLDVSAIGGGTANRGSGT